MRRRTMLRVSGAGLMGSITGLAGCLAERADTAFRDGFEAGMGDWTAAGHVGPEVPADEFEYEVGVATDEAAAGEASLRIWNEGSHDDGTSWAVHRVGVEPGQAYQVAVTAEFWSESESFNTLRNAVMRLGPEPPAAEGDFPDPDANTTELGETPYGGLREPLHLAEGWREYGFEWTTPELATDTLHVAVGTTVVWETEATHYVDEVTVEPTPR